MKNKSKNKQKQKQNKKKMSTQDTKHSSKKYAETIKNLEEENRKMKMEYEERISKIEKEKELLEKKLQLLEHDRNFLYQQVQELSQNSNNPSITSTKVESKMEPEVGGIESKGKNEQQDGLLNFKLTGNSEFITWNKMSNFGKGLKPRLCGNSKGVLAQIQIRNNNNELDLFLGKLNAENSIIKWNTFSLKQVALYYDLCINQNNIFIITHNIPGKQFFFFFNFFF